MFAIFHLLMHGVFKAGLFLGAGSVMHGMKDNVNMRRYGALRAFMIVTSSTFIICYLAIIGIPPFDGFFSKDDIIHASFERSPIIGILAMLAAGLTGFYMTRMVAMTFFGKARWEDDVHPHESPKVMTIPLIILAIGATFGGMALVYWGNIETWLEPVTGIETVELPLPSWAYELTTLVLVLIGAVHRWMTYARREVPVEAPHGSWLTRAAREELYGNQVNDVLVVAPTLLAVALPRVVRQQGRRRLRQRQCRLRRRAVRTNAPVPDRVRSFVCVVDGGWRRLGRPRPGVGEGLVTYLSVADHAGGGPARRQHRRGAAAQGPGRCWPSRSRCCSPWRPSS